MDRTINFELARLRQISRELAERGPTSQVCEGTASILTGPLKQLFTESFSEPLYELIRLCIQINRRCRAAHPGAPQEPFDAKWFADRLRILGSQIADQLATKDAA